MVRVAIEYRGLAQPLYTAAFKNRIRAQAWADSVRRGDETLAGGMVRCPSGAVLLGERDRMISFTIENV